MVRHLAYAAVRAEKEKDSIIVGTRHCILGATPAEQKPDLEAVPHTAGTQKRSALLLCRPLKLEIKCGGIIRAAAPFLYLTTCHIGIFHAQAKRMMAESVVENAS